MNYALTQFTTETESGRTLEKDFFEKIGSDSNLRVGVICIKDKEQSKLKSRKPPIKTLIVIPSIHPGPFGILGGSNLPVKLYNYLNNITSKLHFQNLSVL